MLVHLNSHAVTLDAIHADFANTNDIACLVEIYSIFDSMSGSYSK